MKRINPNGFSVIEAFLILLVAGFIGLVGWKVIYNKHTTKAAVSGTSAQSDKTASSASVPATQKTLSSGADNANLNSDLNNINSSMSSENSDTNASSAALNDQQNEVQVATN